MRAASTKDRIGQSVCMLQSLVDTCFDPTIIVGAHGRVDCSNDAAQRLAENHRRPAQRLSWWIADQKQRRNILRRVRKRGVCEASVEGCNDRRLQLRARAVDQYRVLIVFRADEAVVSISDLAERLPGAVAVKNTDGSILASNSRYRFFARDAIGEFCSSPEQRRLDAEALGQSETVQHEHGRATESGGKEVFRFTRVPLDGAIDGKRYLLTLVEEASHHLETSGGISVDAGLVKAILDYMPGLLSLKDAHTRRFLFATGMDRVVSGGNNKHFIGKGAADLYAPAMAKRIDDAETRLLAKPEQVVENQFSNVVDGEPRYFYSRKLVVPDAVGKPRYILTFNLDITAQVSAQKALDKTNAFLDAVIDYIPALISVKSIENGKIVRANRRICEFLSIKPDEILGRRLEDVHPDFAAQLESSEECLRDDPGRVVESEIFLDTEHGERWLNSHTVVIPDPDGRPSHIIAIHQDITGRVYAEKELAENRTFLSTIIQQLPLALSVKDAHSRRVLLQNQGDGNVIGNRGNRLSRSILAAPDPSVSAHIERLDDSVLRNARGVIEAELKVPVAGGLRWGHVKKVRINDRQGHSRYILTLFDDITERRQTLENLKLSEATLKRSQAIARIGSWRIEMATGEMEWSDQMFPLLGFDPKSHRPSLDSIIDNLVPEDARKLDAARHKAIRARRDRFGLVVRFVRDDGQPRHLRIDSEIERDLHGEPLSMVGTCQDVTERVEAEKHIRHLAQHDGLTGLPNRMLFDDRLQQAVRHARRHGGKLAVFCLDLNDFKGVNDTLGHAAGDELLRQVAGRLQKQLRDCDTVARLGGDEFAIIQDGIGSEAKASVLAERVLEALADSYRIADQEVFTTASIGIAIGSTDDLDFKELLQQADMALYDAKGAGRGCFRYFSPEMNRALRQRRDIESRLRVALENNSLSLAYQPQYSLRTGELIGVEALLRWSDDELGPVRPDQFIPIAEESGQILQIGEFVLNKACLQASEWHRQGLGVPRMAVNLSPAQFAFQDLAEMVAQFLAAAELPASSLELEITESTLMRDRNGAISTLEALHKIGVTLALDDFGIGYSSLSYLKRFPLDKLKIDRSFVTDIPNDADDIAIARTILSLGKTLGLTVLAEGVETIEQRDFLLNEGCDEVQGFLYARPMPAEETTELLRQSRGIRIAS